MEEWISTKEARARLARYHGKGRGGSRAAETAIMFALASAKVGAKASRFLITSSSRPVEMPGDTISPRFWNRLIAAGDVGRIVDFDRGVFSYCVTETAGGTRNASGRFRLGTRPSYSTVRAEGVQVLHAIVDGLAGQRLPDTQEPLPVRHAASPDHIAAAVQQLQTEIEAKGADRTLERARELVGPNYTLSRDTWRVFAKSVQIRQPGRPKTRT